MMAPVMPVQPDRRAAAMAGDVETAEDAAPFLFYRNFA
jgi:hypothetical protein